jgi:deoxycytidine triphosphate deaminase
MSIKSDRWIRQMAEEHGMIEPFCFGENCRVFPHTSQCVDHLFRQKHICPLRDHRQRDAF